MDECKDIATGATDEAVEDLFRGDDTHRGVAIIMERAQPDILATLGLEREVLTNDRSDIRRVSDALAIIVLWRIGKHRVVAALVSDSVRFVDTKE